jgi:hypothetical protein
VNVPPRRSGRVLQPMGRRQRLLAGVLAAALVLLGAACDDDSDELAAPTPILGGIASVAIPGDWEVDRDSPTLYSARADELQGLTVSLVHTDDLDELIAETEALDDAEIQTTVVPGAEQARSDADDDADANGQETGRLGTVEVDETREHPTNTEVTVTEVEVEPNAVYVSLEAFNGSSEEVSLAFDEDIFIRLLVDDRRLTFRPPEDNPSLEIPPGGELSARLAFSGRVGAEADTIDLLLNWGDEGPLNLDGEVGGSPSFEFRDLPLPDAS